MTEGKFCMWGGVPIERGGGHRDEEGGFCPIARRGDREKGGSCPIENHGASRGRRSSSRPPPPPPREGTPIFFLGGGKRGERGKERSWGCHRDQYGMGGGTGCTGDPHASPLALVEPPPNITAPPRPSLPILQPPTPCLPSPPRKYNNPPPDFFGPPPHTIWGPPLMSGGPLPLYKPTPPPSSTILGSPR